MSTAAFRQILSAFLLLLLINRPTIAAGPDGAYDDDTPSGSPGLRPAVSTREAELRTTLEKRKAKRARDHAAYRRATAQADVMLAAMSPRPPRAALLSLPPSAALQAMNSGGPAGLGNTGAFYQVNGQANSSGVYSTGGTGQCGRR